MSETSQGNRQSAFLNYLEAFLVMGAALLIRWLAEPTLKGQAPFITLYGAVAYSIWRAGLGPAIVVCLVGYLLRILIIPGPLGVGLADLDAYPQVQLAFLLYLLSCSIIIGIGQALRRSNAKLKMEMQGHIEAEQRFRTLIDVAPMAVILAGQDGRLVLANSQAERLFGYGKEELLERKVEDLMPERFRDDHPGLRESYCREPSARLMGQGRDLFALDKEKHEIPVEVGLNPLSMDGRLLVLAVIADISERKKTLDEALESDRRKSEFLSALSHELRNPLAPLLSGLEVINRHEEATPEVRRKLLSMLDRQANQMARLVDDLLDISRVSRGVLSLRLELLDLRTIAETAVEVVRDRVQSVGQTLTVELPEEPVWVEGDLSRLIQMLDNLLVNAHKFTHDRGNIRLRMTAADGRAVVEVEDDGVGMGPEDLVNVFGLFAQSGETLKNRPVGLGVGLALSRQIAELHKGKIEAFSDGPGKGSRFRVELPLSEAPEGDVLAVQELISQIEAMEPRRVMIVDDNTDAAETLALLLRLDGNEVLACYSGEEALRKAGDFGPEVVLMDLGMPGMDGFAAAQALRERGLCADAVFVALSGYGQESDMARTQAAGFEAHLTKPADYRELLEILRKAPQRT